MATPTDPLFGQQWHFPLIGDIETIWNEFDGNGVSVGVYDDGIETDHPDLVANYDDSLEFEFDYDGDGFDETGANIPADPMTGNDGHGTSVAGLIAGDANNGIGGTGVAFGASITSVNIFLDSALYPNDYNAYVASLGYAGVFDIMSNSWGYTPLFEDFQNINAPGAQLINEVAGLELAGATGRGGLGTVIVQAAGNDRLNANGDSINASRFTVTVGATDELGFAQNYSNYGVSLLLAAPAASVTTDLTGTDGYNDGSESVPADYTETFGGTSAATPVVSGVVALMLEANENLGWRDVHNILAVTAAQTGQDLDGSNATIDEIGNWGAESGRGGSTWNGGTLSYHASYGFGMVDAFAAVRMAEVWLDMIGDAQTSMNEQYVLADYDEATNGAIAIPDYDINTNTAGQVTATLNVAQNIQIETILLTVDIDHTWGSDLEIYLVTPDGDQVPVFFRDGSSSTMENGFVWTFEIRALLGFDSQGDWSIVISDQAGGDVGTLNDFQIEFFGSTADTNDIHIISRDFLELTAFDAVRSVITDGNGGSDWLNFVGVNSDGVGNGDVVLNMNNGGSFTVDGLLWGTLDGVFENVVLGDGDDTVTGTQGINEILGMRGDDDIDGGLGFDTIDGGAGNDTLDGAAGIDTIDGGNGEDNISGGNGSDVINGGDDNDLIFGNLGFDDLTGGNGDDDIRGGGGSDVMNGGEGEDTLNGNSGSDTINGGDNDDTLIGQSGSDIMSGDAGDDSLIGGSGRDTLNGGSGDDTLNAGTGQDFLNGGSGTNTLIGGSQADTFQFDLEALATATTINDFVDNQDTLNLDDDLWGGAALTVQDVIDTYGSNSGGNTVFTFGGNTLTLNGIADVQDLIDDIVFV
ncbi:S8 family serine peptidase [Shimia ponticola]|uniref:S8 family serine peptidase n=1 Tax=Shimia ponticola TaxID=2582893 RepID=UPI00164BF849|nr:S8 family serine peptidase [Shimia ponticola]